MKSTIILSDFDGTISLQDVNDTLFHTYGGKNAGKIDKDFSCGKISDKEYLIKSLELIDLTEEEFRNFLEKNITLDPYFNKFYEAIKDSSTDFAIVSSGFANYITFLLNSNEINYRNPIYANSLIFDTKVKPLFLHDMKDCHQAFGVCGNCKYKILKNYKSKYNRVIYIGDGLTDRCAIDDSDILFAKRTKSLALYCQENDLDYIPYKYFNDIYNYLFKTSTK